MMSAMGADDLVPFGGHIPTVFQADDDESRGDERWTADDNTSGIHVVGADPIPPTTTPDRQHDPDIGTVPGSPNPNDPDTVVEGPVPRKSEKQAKQLQQERLDDEQPVDVQAAVDATADQSSV
jgi:hypothetical protein